MKEYRIIYVGEHGQWCEGQWWTLVSYEECRSYLSSWIKDMGSSFKVRIEFR